MNAQLETIFFIIFLIIIFIIIFWIIKTEKRLKRFFLGKKAKDLEETIIEMKAKINYLEKEKAEIEKDLIKINQKLKKSIRGLEIVRFNPFPDQGSNQSFALSFLNEEKDGVVISSLYARERMSIFAKPIKNGISTYELTDEEKEVLEKAAKKII